MPKVVGAISLGIALYFYAVVSLATMAPHYLETVNRISMDAWFTQSLSGTPASDQAVLLGLSLLFTSTLFAKNRYRGFIAAVFAAVLLSQLISSSGQLLVASLSALPASIFVAARAKGVSEEDSKHDNQRSRPSRKVLLNLVAVSFLSLAISVEAASLVEKIAGSGNSVQDQRAENAASLESGIFGSFAVASPAILTITAFSFLYRGYIILAAKKLLQKQVKRPIGSSESARQSSGTTPADTNFRMERSSRYPWLDWVLLAIAVTVSTLVAIYPHLPAVNPSNYGVSTDERAYLGWMEGMQNRSALGPMAVVEYAFNASGSDRPLSLLILHASGVLSGSYHSAVRYAPIALAPALVVSTYVLARYGLRSNSLWPINRRQSAIIAMFAALSPQVVVGVYAGFLANWIALIPAIFSVLFLARSWDSADLRKAKWHAVAFFGLLITTMLCHVYVWGQLIVVSSIFLVLSTFSARSTVHFGTKIILLALAISGSVAVDIAKSEALGVPSGLSRDTGVAGYSFNLDNFDSRWSTLSSTLSTYVGGYITVPILLALTLLWVFRMRMSANSIDRTILAMLFALAIPILFGSMTVQARLLYNTPFFIPAAVALLGLTRARLPTLLAFAFVILVLSNYAVGAMANLNLVVPDNAILENPFLVP